jgi:hypothetical protein
MRLFSLPASSFGVSVTWVSTIIEEGAIFLSDLGEVFCYWCFCWALDISAVEERTEAVAV